MRRKTDTPRNETELYYGSEPSLDTAPSCDNREEFMQWVGQSLNWYTFAVKNETKKAWFVRWVQDNAPEEVTAVQTLPDATFSTAGALARLASRGCECDYLLEHLFSFHDRFVRRGKSVLASKQEARTEKKFETKEVDVRLCQLLESLESNLDAFIRNNCQGTWEMKEWLASFKPSLVHLGKIREIFSRRLAEVSETLIDAEMAEAYSHLSRPQRKRLVVFLTDIVETKKTRKTGTRRKKKIKDSSKILAKVQLGSEDKELNLKGLEAKEILNSNCLLTWNMKYRLLGYFVAEEGTSFTVKGTTIQNFDEGKSFIKKLRKPEEVIPELMRGTKASIRKSLEALSTKKIPARGRLNEDMILLRVV